MRLQEAGVGFKFESGQIIKVDSEFLHSEVVKPVLHLLGTNKIYEGINNEFLKAHEHYRHQKYKECLVFCAKSIESLLKAIHEKNKWEYKETDTYAKLINSSFDNSLILNYLENQFSGLKQLLATGVNVIRNREGAHGQGSEIKEIPEHLASYVLHLTASNLLFLMKSAVNN